MALVWLLSKDLLKCRKPALLLGFCDVSLYSNSGVDRIIQTLPSTHLCCFMFIFSEFYLIFFPYQIIRAKIEPSKTIHSALISLILIALLYAFYNKSAITKSITISFVNVLSCYHITNNYKCIFT